jgi:CheY-like chemotaxis protein
MMIDDELVIIVTEDDEGHALLIIKNLRRAGIKNEILHFRHGQEALDFLFQKGNDRNRVKNTPYLLLLDIQMQNVDGIEVLRQIKRHEELRKIPTIMVTTTDDPQEIEKCYELGCSVYITKPVSYDKFIDAIKRLGLFIMVVEVPKIYGERRDGC